MAAGVIRTRQAPDVCLRTCHELPGAEILCRTRQRPHTLGCQQVGFDGGGDAAGNLVLHGKDVAEFPIVAFGPVMAAGSSHRSAAR